MRRQLTALERNTYRRRLRAMAARLSGDVTELEAAACGEAVPADGAEPAVRDTEEAVAWTLLGSEEQLLAEVNAALARLSAGTFGACEKCSHVIGRARLDAIPYARTCIRCAQAGESTSGAGN